MAKFCSQVKWLGLSSAELLDHLPFMTPKIKLTMNPSITIIRIPSPLRVIVMVLNIMLAVPTIAASSGSLLFML